MKSLYFYYYRLNIITYILLAITTIYICKMYFIDEYLSNYLNGCNTHQKLTNVYRINRKIQQNYNQYSMLEQKIQLISQELNLNIYKQHVQQLDQSNTTHNATIIAKNNVHQLKNTINYLSKLFHQNRLEAVLINSDEHNNKLHSILPKNKINKNNYLQHKYKNTISKQNTNITTHTSSNSHLYFGGFGSYQDLKQILSHIANLGNHQLEDQTTSYSYSNPKLDQLNNNQALFVNSLYIKFLEHKSIERPKDYVYFQLEVAYICL